MHEVLGVQLDPLGSAVRNLAEILREAGRIAEAALYFEQALALDTTPTSNEPDGLSTT